MTAFRDDFNSDALDSSVWVPHYLPEWSSRQATRASFHLDESCLQLFLPPGAGSEAVPLSSPAG